MRYYKVKVKSDLTKHCIRTNHDILVANELYTEREIVRAIEKNKTSDAFVNAHFDIVDVSPKRTYWFFGARFEVTNNN